MKTSANYPDPKTHTPSVLDLPKRRISWGAVFAGALIALTVQLLLSLLGLGIGFSTINPESEAGNAADGLGVGAAIWWFLSSLLALFAGGMVAGRLSGMPRQTDTMLHGLLAWSLTTLVTFYLITTSLGALISGAAGMVGKGLTLAGKGVAAVAPGATEAVQGKLSEHGIDLTSIRQEAETMLRQTGKPELQPENLQAQAEQAGNQAEAGAEAAASDPANTSATLDGVMKNLFREGQDTVAAADREAAVNVVVERTGKTRAEAEQIVDRWIAFFETSKAKVKETAAMAEQKAREAGEKAASALSKASLMAFFGLVLGGAAAALGGRASAPSPVTEHKTTIATGNLP